MMVCITVKVASCTRKLFKGLQTSNAGACVWLLHSHIQLDRVFEPMGTEYLTSCIGYGILIRSKSYSSKGGGNY